MKITEFHIQINHENVLNMIDCVPSSPVYKETLEELTGMLEEAYRRLRPVALLGFGSTEGFDLSKYGGYTGEALYNLNSVGEEISDWSSELFAEGDYLKGMLADAIADDCLFQMDQTVQKEIVKMCRDKKCGVSYRLEAPQDIPMSIHRRAWEAVRADKTAGIDLLESMMFRPVKTSCQVFLLDEDSDEFRLEHDCSRCPRDDCKFRNRDIFPVIVKQGARTTVIRCRKGQSLMSAMQEQRIYTAAVCGGSGTCGKCGIQVLEGTFPPCAEDRRFYSQEMLERGFRLSCRAFPEEACKIALENSDEEAFEVIAGSGPSVEETVNEQFCRIGAACAIAADIGTTTIAMQLIDLEQKKNAGVYTAVNRQRAYGADVIIRIEASNNGKAESLRKSILEELEKGIDTLIAEKNIVVK